MKKRLLIFFSCIAFSITLSQNLSEEVMDFGTNPGNLSLFYYAPNSAKPGRPLVVVLHGCSQGAAAVAELTGWNKLADRYGFYLAYPQQHFPNNPSHCFNWFKKNDIEKGNGECESVRQMTEYMIKRFQLNRDSVFITGLSAGAAMSVVMIATEPSLFKSAAIFAGGPYKPGNNIFSSSGTMIWGVNKTPEEWKELVWRENPAFKGKYPKVIVYHGTADPIVNIRNANELVEQWTFLNKGDTIPDRIDSTYLGKRDIMRLAYFDKDNDEAVVFYKINDLGHAVPIDPGNCFNQGGKSGVFGTIKNYFATYYTACDFGLVPEWKITGPSEVTANSKNIKFSINSYPNSTITWEAKGDCKIIERNGNSMTVSFNKSNCEISAKEVTENGCWLFHQPLYIKVK